MLATGPRAHQPARFGPDRAGSAARRPAETRESSTWRYWYSYGEVELPDQGCVGRLSPIRRADQLLSSHARDQGDAPPHHRDDQASHDADAPAWSAMSATSRSECTTRWGSTWRCCARWSKRSGIRGARWLERLRRDQNSKRTPASRLWLLYSASIPSTSGSVVPK